MQTVLHVSSRLARRSLLDALRERGHEVRVEEENEAPVWDAGSRPDLLVVEVPAGHVGAMQCRRLINRAAPGGAANRRDSPYMLAVVAPGGGDDALEAGADSFITGVDAELDAHLALAERAIERRRKRTAAEAALSERAWEFRTVADHERDLIAILRAGPAFRYVFVNRTLAAAMGLPVEYVVGKTVNAVPLPLDDPSIWSARLADVVDSGHQRSYAVAAGARRAGYSAVLIPEFDARGGVRAVLVIACTEVAGRHAASERGRTVEGRADRRVGASEPPSPAAGSPG
jgi:PAS domain-containing protein